MKRFLYILATTCLFLSIYSCKDENEEPVIPSKLEVDKQSFTVGASASKESFVITSNKDWTVTTDVSWLALAPSSGKAGSTVTVEMAISTNEETESRSAVITVKIEDLSVQVEITQSGKEIIPTVDGIEIPDENFKQYLVKLFDLNGDGEITQDEAEAVTFMDCSGLDIESMTGLEYFIRLDTLICKDNLLTGIDISNNVLLVMFCCENNSIKSLDISSNPELAYLSCHSNQLTAFNAVNASKLEYLNCSSNNALSDLDVSGNAALTALDCSGNHLEVLNLENSAALTALDCSNNQLTALDISKNLEIRSLICSNNQLTVLDVSSNTKLEKLDCVNNEFLTQILLAEGQEIPELIYDEETTDLIYPETLPEKTYIDIPDAIFKAYLVANFDTDKDGEISEEEALMIKEIRSNRMDIVSMTGIECFPNLETLFCTRNRITHLNTSKNLKLKDFSCSGNWIIELDISANTELCEFNCSENNLTELNTSKNIKLEYLDCRSNNIKSLDVRGNRVLISLDCRDNPSLSNVFLETGQRIQYIYMDSPPTSLVNMNYIEIKDEAFLAYLLEHFDTDHDQKMSEMEIKNITAMDCSNLDIELLDGLNLFTNLTSLTCSGNKLTSIDLSTLTKLVTLICDNNQLSQLNISQNTALQTLDCSHNALVALGTSANRELQTLICTDNKLTGFNLDANTKLETLLCQNNSLVRWIDVSNSLLLHTLNCQNNPQLLRVNLRVGQTIENLLIDNSTTIGYVGDDVRPINILDSKFFAYLIENFDSNGDGVITRDEAAAALSIDCSGLGISSLSGIEYFTNLTSLNCSNNQLTYLLIDELTDLELLDCSDNQLTSLEVSSLKKLGSIYCRRNKITALDVMFNPELVYIDCQSNQLSLLTIRRNPKMRTLICYDNLPDFKVYVTSSQFTSVNISITSPANIIVSTVVDIPIDDPIFEYYIISNFDKDGDGSISPAELAAITDIDCSNMNISSLSGINYFTNLQSLNCSNNKLSSLVLLGLTNLETVNCGLNNLTVLDLSNMTSLLQVYCHDNLLNSINVTGSLVLKCLFCPGNRLTALDVSTNLALEVLDCSENSRLTTVYMSSTLPNADFVVKDDHTNIEFIP